MPVCFTFAKKMKTLIAFLTFMTLTPLYAGQTILFFGEFNKPLKNCKFYLFEEDKDGGFVKAIFRGKKLENGSIILDALPKHYSLGVVSDDNYRRWWSNDNSSGISIKITAPQVAVYVPPVGHVEIKVSNPNILGEGFENRIRCSISGEGIGKSFPISFQPDGSFVIEDRRPGKHQITITSNDGKIVLFKSEVFEIEKMKKVILPLVTLTKP